MLIVALTAMTAVVLILVLMDNQVTPIEETTSASAESLNPCFNG